MHGVLCTQFSINIIILLFMQGNSVGVLFINGLVAELPTIFNSFFTNTTSYDIGLVGKGW